MMNVTRSNVYRSMLALLIGGFALGTAATVSAANPCAAKPAMNPCAAKPAMNPCAAGGSGGMKKPMMNPCAANPCAAGGSGGMKKPMINPCAANPCAAGGSGGMKKPMMNPCAANPCAGGGSGGMKKPMMNPCAANPCAAKPAVNPCAARAGVDPDRVLRPAGTSLFSGNRAELERLGEKLFNDPRLSSNELSCNSCHNDQEFYQSSFAKPYPHFVQMTKEKAGVTAVSADEMVQFCMVVPMEAKPLPWNSRELAALTAYVEKEQKIFMKKTAAGAMNPCAAKPAMNPCAAKNPCGVKKS